MKIQKIAPQRGRSASTQQSSHYTQMPSGKGRPVMKFFSTLIIVATIIFICILGYSCTQM